MPRIKERELQCVYDPADGIYDASGQKPAECSGRHGGDDLADRSDAYPAHCDINAGGKPLRAVYPQSIDQDAGRCDPPHKGEEPVAGGIAQNDQADRGVGTRDQDKDHHMIDLPQDPVDPFGDIEGVVDRTCGV